MKDIIKGFITLVITCACTVYVQDYITPLSKFWPSVVLFVGMFCATLFFMSGVRQINKRFNKWVRKMGAR